MFVDDPVSVGGDSLLGRRVEVISARVVFVGRPELYRMFLRESIFSEKKTWLDIFRPLSGPKKSKFN